MWAWARAVVGGVAAPSSEGLRAKEALLARHGNRHDREADGAILWILTSQSFNFRYLH